MRAGARVVRSPPTTVRPARCSAEEPPRFTKLRLPEPQPSYTRIETLAALVNFKLLHGLFEPFELLGSR